MKEKFTVTLKKLREADACLSGYNKVVRSLQGKPFSAEDEDRNTYIRFAHKDEISVESILNSNGLDDAIWSLRCVSGADRDCRLFAVWCARQVQHLMADPRSIAALDVAERHANGDASDSELSAAWAAAGDVAWDAAGAAAGDVARAAARDVAWDAAWGAALGDVARAAARDVALDAAWDAQKEMFINMLHGKAPWQVAKQKDEE